MQIKILLITVLLLTAFVLLFLTAVVWKRRYLPAGLALAGVTFLAFIWTLGTVFELLSATLSWKIFWADIEYAGIAFLPWAWLALVVFYTRASQKWKAVLYWASFLPILMTVLIWTDRWHHLFRRASQLDLQSAPFPVLESHYGVLFYIFYALGSGFLVLSLVVLFQYWQVNPKIYRQQKILLLLSLAVPFVASSLFVLGISPIPHFNITPVLFVFSAGLLSAGIFRLEFLNFLPLAYQALIENTDVGIIILNNQMRLLDCNPAAQKLFGIARERALGQDVFSVCPSLAPLRDADEKTFDLNLTVQGEEYVFQAARQPVLQFSSGVAQPAGHIITLMDITEKVRLYQKVERLASIDPLTGAYNRRLLMRMVKDKLEMFNRSGQPFSLILLDMDDFKQINDRWGHLCGDLALQKMMTFLQDNLRAYDQVFRYGGDEFFILLPDCDAEKAVEIGGRLFAAVSKHAFIVCNNEKLPLSFSGGFVSVKPGDCFETLLQRADRALYRAKEMGKGQFFQSDS